VRVVWGDVLKSDLAELVGEHFGGMKVSLCSNLPYYITTPAIARILECGVRWSSVVLMVQREVADRICAAPGTAAFGAFTLFVGYHAVPRRLFDVSPGSFFPAPKVRSTVICLTLRGEPPVAPADPELMFRVIRTAFNARRKTLANALRQEWPQLGREAAEAAAGGPHVRGETLGLEGFAEVSSRLCVALRAAVDILQ